MVSFEEIIGNLLLRHNCVVIPDFGGFVAKQSAARIDIENGIVHPPKKSILFNRQLINNDGLMINEYANQQQIPFEQALLEIKGITSSWLKELHNGRRVSIEKVGYLFQDEERNICFEQDRHFNLLLSSFGLGQVHFIAQEDVELVKRKIAIETETPIPTHDFALDSEVSIDESRIIPINQKETHKKTSPIWKYVAAVAAIPVVFYSIWIPMKTDVLESNMLSTKDFNPFKKEVVVHYATKDVKTKSVTAPFFSLDDQIKEIKKEDVVNFSYSLTEDAFVLVDLYENKDTKNIQIAESQIQAHFIVGCFADQNNAFALVTDLKYNGFKGAKILDHNKGLYRVTIGGAISLSELDQMILRAKTLGIDGWLLK